jgi:hypothetical protein
MARGKQVYKIIFHNQGKIYEMHAKRINPGSLLGFVEVEGLLFGTGSGVLVDPSEERLKAEFVDVKRTYIPMHAVIRIDEVEKEGINKITAAASDKGDNVTPFPAPLFTTKRDTP